MEIQWGNVADWAAAIGTVGALLGTVTVIRRDHVRRQEEHEQDLWDEALLVDATFGQTSYGAPDEQGRPLIGVSCSVENNGRRPIQDVKLTLLRPGREELEHEYGSVPARTRLSFVVPAEEVDWRAVYRGGGPEFEWTLDFTNVAGWHWVRSSDRHLRRSGVDSRRVPGVRDRWRRWWGSRL